MYDYISVSSKLACCHLIFGYKYIIVINIIYTGVKRTRDTCMSEKPIFLKLNWLLKTSLRGGMLSNVYSRFEIQGRFFNKVKHFFLHLYNFFFVYLL